jgi:hypothetical protein
MDRAYEIACRAHAYRLLAERPELWTHDRAQRLRHAFGDAGSTVPYTPLDTVLVWQAGELDIVCAYAVALLRRPGSRTTELADLLGMLTPDRLLAVYYALPRERRKHLRRDAVWVYQIGHGPPEDEIIEAMHDWQWYDREPMSETSRNLARAQWPGAPARR